ncbi:MAG: energy-coupling factor ABC transporter ATP-binding protein [Chlorobium sp.]|jgi:cobalt/nickel transport system ATP-binding protein|uniref:energy-coupling factor ABC transporter ATP-binding protein n=1 Tax=Chlorobium sp. TaxID=1095 RepID=UPI001E10DC23|nr:energy-coupling factor ABC transporter ATP-binding protein [Chlorobium sp.]MBN1278814.1 energy-coupling factor ABC transporter ATP-binding protein [Chlorobiaceae bacterium]MCF8216450.1 energy-coupling factor ABC transporter ATP-binding protein [Chlorobium sp.]MCF8271384.1 energy-coupling factor ABC transporter ATP-binding protein [Chlorobium sp.]MCF8287727.1 energy-coupling factor ABC transporter ATP-binding protein [Chlorobium sp.]MCF8291295.1 energy-coupling factor ABC transporter ATP-bin
MITVERLSFTYPDGTKALRNVSLSIHSGESAGIIGANGAGKSTLVNHINGWLIPQSGSMTVDGIKCLKTNQETLRQKVGLVFQNPDDQLFMSSLFDDIMFGPDNLGIPREKSEAEAERLLREFGLWELREKPPSRLSQGQKRFAAFAGVLVMHPSVLVMDEPTSDLDPRNRKKLISLVSSLSSTKITVSHDLDFIWDTCRKVFIMNNGQIKAQGPAREILVNETLLEDNGLELPLRLQR